MNLSESRVPNLNQSQVGLPGPSVVQQSHLSLLRAGSRRSVNNTTVRSVRIRDTHLKDLKPGGIFRSRDIHCRDGLSIRLIGQVGCATKRDPVVVDIPTHLQTQLTPEILVWMCRMLVPMLKVLFTEPEDDCRTAQVNSQYSEAVSLWMKPPEPGP